MAGWSKLDDNSCLHQCNAALQTTNIELQRCFYELVSRFLKGSCEFSNCFRPLPPRLGNGLCVDLLKLYFVVKFFGGFEAISGGDLWGEVSLQCGFESRFSCAFKLIYAKYLKSLQSWLGNLDKEEKVLMEVERDYSAFMSRFMDGKRRDGSCSLEGEKSDVSFINLTDEDNENDSNKLDWKKLVMDFADSEGSNEGSEEPLKSKQANVNMISQSNVGVSFADSVDSTEVNYESMNAKQLKVEVDFASDEGLMDENHDSENLKQVKSEMSFVDGFSSDGSVNRRFSAWPAVADDVVKSTENSVVSEKKPTKVEEEGMTSGNTGLSKQVSSHKRKRDCLSGMLHWMANVAKNPTDLSIGTIPEPRRWASYGNDICWKQVLKAREALFLKKSWVSNTGKFGCQKRQKMHPSLYDDNEASSMNNLHQSETNPGRPRQRMEARLDLQPTAFIYTCRPQQRIPVGKAFQAEVPEWTGVAIESDSKWLGTQIWPLDITEKRPFLIERDPIGKGRVDNCGCQFPGSTDCVNFHVTERRVKIRNEMGSASTAWRWYQMGENCTISWTPEEDKIFKRVVRENPQSMQKSFWESMRKALPQKTWADLVNYYFNVFKLRRRGYQNRLYPNEIDSDDDETEYRSTSNSIKHGAK